MRMAFEVIESLKHLVLWPREQKLGLLEIVRSSMKRVHRRLGGIPTMIISIFSSHSTRLCPSYRNGKGGG